MTLLRCSIGFSTILIEPSCTARLSEDGDIVIEIEEQAHPASKSTSSVETMDITTLSIFSHRFMSIAEQMVCSFCLFYD